MPTKETENYGWYCDDRTLQHRRDANKPRLRRPTIRFPSRALEANDRSSSVVPVHCCCSMPLMPTHENLIFRWREHPVLVGLAEKKRGCDIRTRGAQWPKTSSYRKKLVQL